MADQASVSDDVALRRAAHCISEADAIIVCSGAGMGVDSGLGTFRGARAGVWAPLQAVGIDYRDACVPKFFKRDPRFAWAFWGAKYHTFTTASPHDGYTLLAKWGAKCKHGIFSATSNLDGHWLQVLDACQVWECHGAVTHLQSTHAEDQEVWCASGTGIPEPPEAPPLLPGTSVRVRRQDGTWLDTAIGADGRVPECHSETLTGIAVGAGEDLLRISEHVPLPMDKAGHVARPNVVMFDDTARDAKGCRVRMSRIEEQEQGFRAWLASLPADCRLAVLEIGAGDTVGTMRRLAAEMLSTYPKAMLLRINAEQAAVEDDRAVGVSRGALDALLQIDRRLMP